jgi:hypothetical protein
MDFLGNILTFFITRKTWGFHAPGGKKAGRDSSWERSSLPSAAAGCGGPEVCLESFEAVTVRGIPKASFRHVS